MTRFQPGDRAIVTGDTAGWLHSFEPGAVVVIGHTLRYNPGYECLRDGGSAKPNGEASQAVADADLDPAPDATAPTAPSPPDALIESAATFLRAVLANRVSIEQERRETNRTTYRIAVAPEEKS